MINSKKWRSKLIMRKNFGAKPLTYPQPVYILAAYAADGTPDAMNAAWGGISDDKEISLCISAGHKTTKNILESKAFTISMADVKISSPATTSVSFRQIRYPINSKKQVFTR